MLLLKTGDSFGKLTRRSDVRIWVDGKQSFRRLENLLRRARFSIVIQMFIWKDDATGRRIAVLLADAADRGVQVDITKEAVGDVFEFHGDFLGTKHSTLSCWQRFWNHPRIRIRYGANNDHAKVYVIDEQVLLLTGMNIADESRYMWHDYLVELRGAHFVQQFLERSTPAPDTSGVQLVMNTEDQKQIRPALMTLLHSARERIVVEHCYLSDPEVVGFLISASHKGIRVVVILPKEVDFHHHANMLTVGKLMAEGKKSHLRLLVYPGMFHSKIILVDFQSAFLGSANLFKSSLDEMGEVNVLISGKRRALWKLRESLRHDILLSRAIAGPRGLWMSRWLAWLGL